MVKVELKSLLGRLNGFCTRSLEGAAGLCVSRGHYEVTVEHMLYKFAENPQSDLAMIAGHFDLDGARVLRSLQQSVETMRTGNSGKPVFSPILIQWIQDAWVMSSIDLSLAQIRSGALIGVMAGDAMRYLSGDHPELEKIQPETLKQNFMDIVAGSDEEAEMIGTTASSAGGAPGAAAGPGGDSALARFTVNFTERARQGDIDPIFGRDKEIRQMVDILARRRKNNPICVGEAGVGKTAVIEGLALRIVEGDVPDLLKNVEIHSLDMGLLQAGAGVKGEFENRLNNVINEIKGSPTPIITFIDEAHTLIGAGGPAGGGDAANLLKPALARGELRTIAATTWAEYKKHIEEDPALARRFQAVKLDEPSVETAAVILRGLRTKYEEVHGVRIRDDSLEAAAKLSARYITGRQLPDKAVDLMDTASARVKIGLTAKPGVIEDLERRIQLLEREIGAVERDREAGTDIDTKHLEEITAEIEKTRETLATQMDRWKREKVAVDCVIAVRDRIEGKEPAEGEAPTEGDKPASPEELKAELATAMKELAEIQGREPMIPVEMSPDVVAQVIGDWTGIPVGSMVADEAETVLHLEDKLRRRIKGQDHALGEIAEAIRNSKAGVGDPDKPVGIFLLAGPSGVGKTETALAVADLMFGGERFMTTVNMSEYQDREMGVSGLVGARPGYVGYGKGGVLTEGVRQRPYSVVLLDEIEKAAQEVRNIFFQVFDKGALTDGTGRDIDFTNTIIFVTSNVGLQEIQQLCAASPFPDPKEILTAVRPVLSKVLTPAWLARTTVIPYMTLPMDALQMITELKIRKIGKRLASNHRMELVVDPKVTEAIAERCNEVETGARNIDHILQGSLMPAISTAILQRIADETMPEQMMLGVDKNGGFKIDFS